MTINEIIEDEEKIRRAILNKVDEELRTITIEEIKQFYFDRRIDELWELYTNGKNYTLSRHTSNVHQETEKKT